MKANKKNVFARFVTMALTGAMLASTGLPSVIASAAGYDLNGMSGPNNLSYNGKFYSDYNSLEEVFEAANELNAQVVEILPEKQNCISVKIKINDSIKKYNLKSGAKAFVRVKSN